ncbi:hypothetical protein L1F30_01360 [Simiduia sp. 21SJ11W-1]|uniref:hypothetical protein n=1 Tax=Simiduia sp. 21SJ11W-1 TaxID=2909669 RepID=UPI00209E9233|nr:hypothetical protein [Simiduia sp. 21SJ11W-1]UTA48202.1 hypothetical protein L1F30_01360 [Simiduia sp. 21SJ11W-1]
MIKHLMIAGICLAMASPLAYAKKDKDHNEALPPGLQKKVQQGKPLPPGWEKKLSRGDRLDDDIYARGRVVVPIGRDGSVTIEVDGRLIRLHEKTREILDILTPHH